MKKDDNEKSTTKNTKDNPDTIKRRNKKAGEHWKNGREYYNAKN